jgi:hypothetical protein
MPEKSTLSLALLLLIDFKRVPIVVTTIYDYDIFPVSVQLFNVIFVFDIISLYTAVIYNANSLRLQRHKICILGSDLSTLSTVPITKAPVFPEPFLD